MKTYVYGFTLIVTDVEIYLYDTEWRLTLVVVAGCFTGWEGCVKISQRYSVQGYKENVLYHIKSAITVIYIYSLYTTDHVALLCAILFHAKVCVMLNAFIYII